MRKIGSEQELEKKRKRTVMILSFFMLVVLVLGTVGYGFIYSGSSSNAAQEENGISQAQSLSLSYPQETVREIPVEITLALNNYIGKTIYISSKNPQVTREIAANLGKHSARVQEACYGSCSEDLPEKDCSENLIVWEDSIENKVYQEENCIFIQGDIRAVDAFLYKILGFQ